MLSTSLYSGNDQRLSLDIVSPLTLSVADELQLPKAMIVSERLLSYGPIKEFLIISMRDNFILFPTVGSVALYSSFGHQVFHSNFLPRKLSSWIFSELFQHNSFSVHQCTMSNVSDGYLPLLLQEGRRNVLLPNSLSVGNTPLGMGRGFFWSCINFSLVEDWKMSVYSQAGTSVCLFLKGDRYDQAEGMAIILR